MTTKTSRRVSRIKLELLWKNGKRCAICGKRIRHLDDLTVDHIIPLAKGGKNVVENCQLAHRECNGEKRDILPEIYDQLRRYNRTRIIKLLFYRMFQYW